jgi:hypothetical protein
MGSSISIISAKEGKTECHPLDASGNNQKSAIVALGETIALIQTLLASIRIF